jgi:hypothetical protein
MTISQKSNELANSIMPFVIHGIEETKKAQSEVQQGIAKMFEENSLFSGIPNIVILNKKTKEEIIIPTRDFLNPQSSICKGHKLKPLTFNQAFTMLIDMLSGDIYQTPDNCVKLVGVKYKFDW